MEVIALALPEIALAALTPDGRQRAGALGDLSSIAGWIDYVNHDGCTAAEVRSLLQQCVDDGVLSIEGDRWRLGVALMRA